MELYIIITGISGSDRLGKFIRLNESGITLENIGNITKNEQIQY